MYGKIKKYVYFYPVCLLVLLGSLWVATPAQAQDGSGVPTVKVRRKKKKVKKVNPNKRARPVKDKYERPRSQSIDFSREKRYIPPSVSPHSGQVKDDYKRPKSLSGSDKVKVSDARPFSEPDAEEGKERPHLPFIDRVFNRHNRYFRQKERYLQNMSFQLNGYKGDWRVRKKDVSPGGGYENKPIGEHQGNWRVRKKEVSPGGGYEDKSIGNFQGHIRQLRPELQEKVEKNKSYYIHGHRGWLRVPSPRAQTRYHKKLATQIHGHTGDIRVKRRRPGENMHPSVHHLSRVGKSSYEKKERHRKRRIWITHIFRSKEQPQHLKEKVRKPRYDSKEADIWNY